jgi:hypothetical protein
MHFHGDNNDGEYLIKIILLSELRAPYFILDTKIDALRYLYQHRMFGDDVTGFNKST